MKLYINHIYTFLMKDVTTLVLGGGGIKGIAYCGAFQRLHELQESKVINLNVKTLCCVSVGSIFGLAYVLGYTYKEMIEEILNKKFMDLVDIQLDNLFGKYGMDSGDNIISWMETLIIKKGFASGVTFSELYNLTGIDFMVCTTNLNEYKMQVFDKSNYPDMQVLKSIRMSMSLPLIYTVQEYDGQVFVDGGLVSNYPIHLFKDNLENVLGFVLLSNTTTLKNEPMTFERYVYNVFQCFILQRTENTFLSDCYERHSVLIKTDINNIIRFSIKRKDKKELIKNGYDSVTNFFEKLKC